MANDWYIKINNAEHGPLSSDKLKLLAQQGKVKPDTPVKKGQAGTWHRATEVHGLFAAPTSQSTPATAKPSPKPASSASTPTPKPHPVVPPAQPQTGASSPVSQPRGILGKLFPSARSSTSSSPGGADLGRSSSASARWYLCEEGKTFGPYSDAELKEMAREGTVGPASQVKAGEHGSLIPASQVPGIDFRPVRAQQAPTTFAPRAKPKPNSKPSYYAPQYKSNSKVLIAGGATVLLVACALTYFFIFRGGGRTEVASQQPSLAANASVPRPEASTPAAAATVPSVNTSVPRPEASTPAAAATVPPAPGKPDPVAAMKEIIARVERGTPHGAVAKNLRYDVKKTDSMISPYTAIVTFCDEYSIPLSISKGEQDARNTSLRSPITVLLAWQDDRWVVKDLYVNVLGLEEEKWKWSATGSPADSSLHDWLAVFGGGPH